MQRMLQRLSLVTLIVITIMVGCAYVPTQEMSDARQAIKAAREVKAISYVPANLTVAEQSLTTAEHYLEAGQFNQARLNAKLATEQAVNAYKMTVALTRAKTMGENLTKIGYATQTVNDLLKQATASAQQQDVDKTITLADEAYHQAELSLNQAQLEQAHLMIEKIQTQQAHLNQHELMILKSAQLAYRRYQGRKAYDLTINLYNKLF
ncbi:MAG: DUF4398 domain-containing protein [Thioploca sp.]|nr:DUF4398 domain-containing protein [Thioploca sp.]